MPRIDPLAPPYAPEIEASLRRWMPPGVAHDPPALFRVLHRSPELASRTRVLGAGLLAHGTLPAADREVVIHRVCALCGCCYEWGMHAAVYAEQVGLTPEQLHATVHGDADDPAWSPRHRTLIRAVDELHATAQVAQSTWGSLSALYDEAQLLEFLVLTGWYRTVSYLANGLLLDDEPWASPFPAVGHDSR